MAERKKIDPLELQRLKMAGELDAAELQKRKIAAHQQRRMKIPANSKRVTVDPIEAKKKKLAASLARRQRKTARPTYVVPKHFVVIVRPNPNPPAIPPTRRQPKAKAREDDPEDEITRRLREAREKLKGL